MELEYSPRGAGGMQAHPAMQPRHQTHQAAQAELQQAAEEGC